MISGFDRSEAVAGYVERKTSRPNCGWLGWNVCALMHYSVHYSQPG